MNRAMIWDRVIDELMFAYRKHPDQNWSRHEFYGILKEEVDEAWSDIKSNAPDEQLEREVLQIMAVCMRFLELHKDESE